MTQLKTSMIIDLAGNLSGRANQFLGSMQRLGLGGSRSMQMLQRSAHAAGQGLDKLGNRYIAMLTGAAGFGAVKMVGDLSERLTQLGVDAGISEQQIDALRKKIYEISNQPDIRINASEMISSIEEVVKATGDLPFAEKNMRNMGLAIRATAGSGKDVGGMVTELQKLDRTASPDNILKALDIFNVQGKAGAVAMRDLASVGPRVFSAYASKRKDADPATFVRELGAALQTIKGGTGNVEQAATSFEALIRVLSDAKKVKALQGAGISIFDPKALKEGREELRPINQIMADIVAKTKGRGTVMSALIGDSEAIRGLQVSNLTENLQKYYNVHADGAGTIADAARNAQEFNASIQSIKTSGQMFANDKLIGPIRSVANYLNSLKPETAQNWLKLGTGLAAVFGGAMVINQVLGAAGKIGGVLGGGKAGKGGAAGGLGGVGKSGPIPVYVVNKHLSLRPSQWMGGKGGGGGGVSAGGAAARTIGLGTAGIISLPAVVAATAIPIGKHLAANEAKWSSVSRLQDILSRQMVMGGGPQSFQAKLIADELTKRGVQDVNGTIKIVIDNDGAARVKTLSSHGSSNVKLNVDSGLTMIGSH